jgi:hypothetical protein
MERAWIIVSGLCLVAASVLMWRARTDAAFVVATLGVVSWFLSMRDRLRKTIITTGDETDSEDDDSVDQDES